MTKLGVSASEAAARVPPAELSSNFSAYLDLVRFSAAAMVVLHHVKLLQVGPDAVRKLIPSYGHEFVIVFFVLSGYVIAATVDRKRQQGFKDYALDRAARIYSVSLPTLLLSTLLSLTMVATGSGGSGTLNDVGWAIALNLVFLAQSWGLNSIPPSNPAFWSLPYEVMYYVLYGCLYFLRGQQRLFWCALVALVAGPKVLLLLPCWLAGVAAYRWRDSWALPSWGCWLLVASPVLVFGVLSYLHFGALMHSTLDRLLGPYYPGLAWSTEFPKDYISATFVALHLFAVRKLDLSLPKRLNDAATGAATLTFTLYLLHFPSIMLSRELFGSSSKSLQCFAFAILLTIAVTVGVGTYSEARRWQLRAWLQRHLVGPVRAARKG